MHENKYYKQNISEKREQKRTEYIVFLHKKAC